MINDTTFLYLKFGEGIATVAIRPKDNNTVEIGAAFCSPEDRFEKSIGRKLAVTRIKNKKDFYVCFERNDSLLKHQVRDLIKLIVSGRWVSILDFDIELDTTVYDLITETLTEVPCEIAPMVVQTNTVPGWAKTAAIENNFY